MTRLRPARLLAGLAGAAALMLGIGWMMSPQPPLPRPATSLPMIGDTAVPFTAGTAPVSDRPASATPTGRATPHPVPWFDGAMPTRPASGPAPVLSRERADRMSAQRSVAQAAARAGASPSVEALLDVAVTRQPCALNHWPDAEAQERLQSAEAAALRQAWSDCNAFRDIARMRRQLAPYWTALQAEALRSPEGVLVAGEFNRETADDLARRGLTRPAALIEVLYGSRDLSAIALAAEALWQDVSGLTLDGRPLPPAWQANLVIALQLLECELGLDCGPRNHKVVNMCGLWALCGFAGKVDLLRAHPNPPEAFLMTEGRFTQYDWPASVRLAQWLAWSIRQGGPRLLAAPIAAGPTSPAPPPSGGPAPRG
jgi:hypothetical protein